MEPMSPAGGWGDRSSLTTGPRVCLGTLGSRTVAPTALVPSTCQQPQEPHGPQE